MSVIEQQLKVITTNLTDAINPAVQEQYPNFPPLVVFPVPRGDDAYGFDVQIDGDEEPDIYLTDEVLGRARLWVSETLDEILNMRDG